MLGRQNQPPPPLEAKLYRGRPASRAWGPWEFQRREGVSGPSQVDDTDLCDLGNISDGVRSAALPQVRSQLACPILEQPPTSFHPPYQAVETTLGGTPARHFQLEFFIPLLLPLDASRDTPIPTSVPRTPGAHGRPPSRASTRRLAPSATGGLFPSPGAIAMALGPFRATTEDDHAHVPSPTRDSCAQNQQPLAAVVTLAWA